MSVQFSEMEQSIIKNMMLRKSHKDISEVLDCGLEEINAFITAEMVSTGLVSWQAKLNEKHAARRSAFVRTPAPKKIKAPAVPKKSKQEDMEKQIKIDAYKRGREIEANQKNNRRRPPAYKTVAVDYSKLVTIRIDKQTTIYAKPGEEEKTKARFLKNYSKPIDRFNH